MTELVANGIRIHYETGGTGDPVLFISGTGGDLRNRPNVFDGPLVEARHVLSYDQRGLGRTQVPPAPYSMADYADDAAALLDACDWPAVPVIGVSFGGMVAQELALRHPDKVTAVVLACTSSGGAGGASFPLHSIAGLPEPERLGRHLTLADLRRTEAWRAANPERWQKLLDVAAAGVREDRDLTGAANQLEARAGHDTWERLPELDVPVLIAGGRYDGIAPVVNQEALHRQIAGSELALFEGGHLFLVQDKQAWPRIIQWLDAL